MKKEKSILAAFLLNLAFSLVEFFGGLFTGSVAIMSDSVHDAGDAVSIGISYLLERKSTKDADERYTYGYGRYSVIGGALTTLILICGSVGVIYASVRRLLSPEDINYEGMILFAIVGIAVNLFAAYLTHGGESVNRRAVSLHMLEDVLGWVVVLVGAVVMRFTDLRVIDPVMSICTSAVILVGAVRNLYEIIEILTDRMPRTINIRALTDSIMALEGVVQIHHVHVRTIDGHVIAASMHIVTDADSAETKRLVRAELSEFGITHATLELERMGEKCTDIECPFGAHSDRMLHACHHSHK